MGKIVCQWYDKGKCDNEECLEECSFQPGHFEKCAFAKLIDENELTRQFMEDNYDSHGRLLE